MYWLIQAIGDTAPTQVSEVWPISPASSIGTDQTDFNYTGMISAIYHAQSGNVAAQPNAPASLTGISCAITYIHCDSGVNRTDSDIPIACAYCNLLSTGMIDAPLVEECVLLDIG